MNHRLLATLLCLAPGLVAQDSKPAASADHTRIELTQWLDWETVADPRVSPDGKQIAFTRTWVDQVEDRTRSELWLMEADGSRQRFLAAGSDARWSPDGARIAYLAEGVPKGTQVFTVWVATREATQLTHCQEAPSNLQWSHDGKWLACNLQVPEKEGFPIEMPKAPKGAKWIDDPKVITRLNYRRDQSGYAPSGFRHVFVLSADGGSPRQITTGDFDHGAPKWSPDDRELVFDGLRTADAD